MSAWGAMPVWQHRGNRSIAENLEYRVAGAWKHHLRALNNHYSSASLYNAEIFTYQAIVNRLRLSLLLAAEKWQK